MRRLRRLMPGDLPRLRDFWMTHWAGDVIVAHGEVFRPEGLQGFVTDEWDGVVTYCIEGDECEIVSLDSLQEGRGLGTDLVQAVVDEARRRGCRRIVLSTTNDNLPALRFYQKRGFTLVQVLAGAVEEARRIKPGIPQAGRDGIPLRDEIELELKL